MAKKNTKAPGRSRAIAHSEGGELQADNKQSSATSMNSAPTDRTDASQPASNTTKGPSELIVKKRSDTQAEPKSSTHDTLSTGASTSASLSDNDAASSRPSNAVVNPRRVSEGLQQLSPEVMRRLRDSFSLMDQDGSGSVSRDGFKAVLRSLGLPTRKADEMLERTGEPITFGNYLAVMADLLYELPSRDELLFAFESFTRPDGSVDTRDMRAALIEAGVNASQIDAVIEKYSSRTAVFDLKGFSNDIGA